jgi:hypothetical protein
VRYVGAIFVSGAGLWVIITIGMLTNPSSTYADLCGDPPGMCCVGCAVAAWFIFVPVFGFPFALMLFLPGHLFVSWIARKARWWRPLYWIAGWIVTGVIAAALFFVPLVLADRKIIALNINNGILARMAWELVGFTIAFVVFGLLCGFCYWIMLVRAARTAQRVQ